MQLFRLNGSDRRVPRYATVFTTKDSTGSRLSVLSLTQIKETRISPPAGTDPYWNTDQLGKAVAQRKRAGLDCSPDLLAHISPLGWAHILITGEYRWSK